jgi:periplasmic divalent cation tolerance protein
MLSPATRATTDYKVCRTARYSRLARPRDIRSLVSHEIIVFVTTPNSDEANQIANALVSEQLAACVNIVPLVESIYRWEGEVKRDSEALMIIKTTNDRYTELESRVKELHSYSTPEIIALRIEHGSSDYLEWLRHSTVNNEPSKV